MTQEDHIKYWLKTSEHDFESAQKVFDSGRYDWALFIGHLSVEKILKALWVKHFDDLPPKTHNLLKLAQSVNLEIDDERKKLLLDLSGFNLDTRYPDYRLEFYKKCTKEFAFLYIKRIQELLVCIREKI